MSERPNGWWAEVTPDGCIRFEVQPTVYPLEALSRTAHEFTGRAYVFITDEGDTAVVTLRPRSESEDPQRLVGDFCNSLLDHKLRLEIGAATKQIRELIVAQAFVEADLLDRADSNSTLDADPRGLTERR